MPFDGSGNFSPAASPNFPAIGGEVISALYYNNVISDLAAGLSNALTRDGQGKPLVDMNWNGKNLTNAGTIGSVQGAFSGNVTVGGALTVTGATALAGLAAGNTNLTGTLGVSGNTTIGGTLILANAGFVFNSDGAQDTGIRWVSDGVMAMRANAVDRFTVDTTGVSVNGALAVSGLAAVGGAATVSGVLTASTVSNLRGQVNFGTTGHGNIGSDTNTLYLRGNNMAFQDGAASATRMYISSSGYVGIGTTAPAAALHVFGNNGTFGTSAFFSLNAGVPGIGIGHSGAIGVIQGHAAANSAATAGFAMQLSGGNVGIGVLPTANRLQVDGDVGAANFRIGTQLTSDAGTFGFTNGNGPGVVVWGSASAGAGSVDVNVGGNTRLRINTSGGITSSDLADAVGYKGLPQNQRTSAYTLALADMGKHVYTTAGAFAVTVPANSATAFPVGTAITIVNEDSVKTITPAGGVTLILAGIGSTGTRTIAIGAVATLIKVQTDRWYISGAGIT